MVVGASGTIAGGASSPRSGADSGANAAVLLSAADKGGAPGPSEITGSGLRGALPGCACCGSAGRLPRMTLSSAAARPAPAAAGSPAGENAKRADEKRAA